MAEAFLAGMDSRSLSWLLMTNENDFLADNANNNAIIIHAKNRGGATPLLMGGRSPMAYLMLTEETDDYAFGRMSAELPIPVLLGFGPALEQRFRVSIHADCAEIILSNWYENNMLVIYKIELGTMKADWTPTLTCICVDKDENHKIKYSAILESRKLSEEEKEGGFNFAPFNPPKTPFGALFKKMSTTGRKPKMTTITTWELFKVVLNTFLASMLQRQIVIFEHVGNQCIPMIATWGNFSLELVHGQTEMDQRKTMLFDRVLQNLPIFNPLKTADFTVEETAVASSGQVALVGSGQVGKAGVQVENLPDFNVDDAMLSMTISSEVSGMSGSQTSTEPKPKTKSECGFCGASFDRKYDRERHVRTVHLQEKRFVCKVCDKRFSQSSHLKTHVESVHEQKRDSQCEVCGTFFSTKYKLQRHIRSVHLKERPYKCDICGTGYFQRSDMIRHKQHRHMSDSAPPSTVDLSHPRLPMDGLKPVLF
ncbi:hypothetical protein NDN08_002288 [Rhodosorus marinus]|uniref:C2H2-type domain-containing protein n=1 Tax=Rhodosorus marinus TaxID=101924 RepID=A0AAV8UXE6_9RHOD|nr:hypothetical protein NDN08_002288 [Rhodosorus marinus]